MSSRKIIGLLFLGLAILIISSFCIRFLTQSGQFTTIKNVRAGTCQIHAGVKAPEDIVIDNAMRIAYISSLDRKSVSSQTGKVSELRGSIQMLDMASLKPGEPVKFKDVTPDMPKNFHPLGISLFSDKSGVKHLFVINQAGQSTHSVEIFQITSDALVHVKSIDLGAAVEFANNVLAVSADSFYVTDSGNTGIISGFLNFAFQRNNSKVFFVNGTVAKPVATPVATDFVMANGIAQSSNGEEIYVLDTFARSLRFFKRNMTTGALEDKGVLFIGTGVDNINVAEDGSLWMAAHPKLLEFALYQAGWKATSSSQVIHAVPGKKGGGELRTVYLDLGKEISGSSVALSYENNFIIGSALDDKLVVCAKK